MGEEFKIFLPLQERELEVLCHPAGKYKSDQDLGQLRHGPVET